MTQVSKQYQEDTNENLKWDSHLCPLPLHSMPSVLQLLYYSELLLVRNLNYSLCLFIFGFARFCLALVLFFWCVFIEWYCIRFLSGEFSLSEPLTYLKLNAVEFIKAGPGTRLSQALEELSHGLIVQAVRTVEDDTLKHNKTTSYLPCMCISFFPQSPFPKK